MKIQKQMQKSRSFFTASLVIFVISVFVVRPLVYRIQKIFSKPSKPVQLISVIGKASSTHDVTIYSRPNSVIKTLYLEITNIAQGINIAIFVFVVTAGEFFSSFVVNYFSTPLIAITSLLIVIVFWARYYLDTEIIDRSFTVVSLIWFFLYIITQGISISLMTNPFAWFASTSVFLFFGAGFYFLNLHEIKRKQRAGILPEKPLFVIWQKKRMIELIILSILTFSGAILVKSSPILAFSESVVALIVALWQLSITRDYRKLGFIETGV